MKLLTKELLTRFNKVGSQSEEEDPIVIVKFFNPTGAGTWYATEYDEENKIFYGYVNLVGADMAEWGEFSLAELESFRGLAGLGIERDLYFTEKRFSEIKK